AVHARQSPSPPVVAAGPGQGVAALTPAPSTPGAPDQQASPGRSGHEPTTGSTRPGAASSSSDHDSLSAAPSLGGDAPATASVATGHAPSVDADPSPSTSAGAPTAERRDWLAPPRQEAVATAPSSSVSGAVAFIALVGFGGAAVWYRNNRRRGLDQRPVMAALKLHRS